MAEDDNHHIRRHSIRKSRTQTTSSILQPKESLSSPNSPTNTRNPSGNLSRGRQLWNRAVESVLEHERSTPTSISMTSSTVGNEPIGWYNLTKR